MTDTVTNLLPCPFCGGAAKLTGPNPHRRAVAYCGDCGSMGEDGTVTEATANWNRRAAPAMDNSSGPMLRARRIVESHIAAFGMIPHPDRLKEVVAAALEAKSSPSSQGPAKADDGWVRVDEASPLPGDLNIGDEIEITTQTSKLILGGSARFTIEDIATTKFSRNYWAAGKIWRNESISAYRRRLQE